MIGTTLRAIYVFLTSPSEIPEAYNYLPYHGAIFPVLLINIAFVLFAFRIGPWFMRNHKPYNLKRVIIVYNVFQIIFNSIMFILSCRLSIIYLDSPRGFGCIEQLSYGHPYKNFEIFCTLLYLSNKFLDYMETLFFILRKSFKQVTFLHVYHHIMMTTYIFIYIRIQGTGGHSAFAPMINTLIHTIMYIYYMTSLLNEHIKKSLWWKKYITQIQLIQFVIGFIHQLFPLLFVKDCPFPKIWIYGNLLQVTALIYLFGKFYIKAYLREPNVKKVIEKKL